MAASLEIEVALQIPSNVTYPEGLSPNAKHAFPLSEDPKSASAAVYYTALSAAIREAQAKAGDELTRWRDASAAAESAKEPKSKGDNEDEDEDEDSEEA